MSAPTVGTCTDCIVSLPPQPKTSLVLALEMFECDNLIRKSVARFNGNYPANNLTEVGISIAPGGSFATNPVTAVCVTTDQPLQVTISTNGNLFTMVVNQVLILDGAYDSVTVHNPAAVGGNTANVFIACAV